MIDFSDSSGLIKRIPPLLVPILVACVLLLIFSVVFLVTDGSIPLTVLAFAVLAGAIAFFVRRFMPSDALEVLDAGSGEDEGGSHGTVQDPELQRLLAIQNSTATPDDSMFDDGPDAGRLAELQSSIALHTKELKRASKDDLLAWGAQVVALAEEHVAAGQIQSLSGDPEDVAAGVAHLKNALAYFRRASKNITSGNAKADWLRIQSGSADALMALAASEYTPTYYEEAIERLNVALQVVEPDSPQARDISLKRDQARRIQQQKLSEDAMNDAQMTSDIF